MGTTPLPKPIEKMLAIQKKFGGRVTISYNGNELLYGWKAEEDDAISHIAFKAPSIYITDSKFRPDEVVGLQLLYLYEQVDEALNDN